jgi:hypothetical protein
MIFWLKLCEMFQIHDAIHNRLRDQNDWVDPNKGP